MLTEPQDVATDPDGNVIVVLKGQNGNRYEVPVFLCRTSGTYFGHQLDAGKAYLLGGDADGYTGYPKAEADGTIGVNAYFDGLQGVTTDDQGNIFLADRFNNKIRRIDKSSGQVVTVATMTRPHDVTWAKDGNNEVLYIWQGAHTSDTETGNAICRITIPAGGPYTEKTPEVVMGGLSKLGDPTDGPIAGATLRLLDPSLGDVPTGGIVVTPDNKFLYFSDAQNHVLRRIDLQAQTVKTVAGGGATTGDAEPLRAKLQDISGLAIDAKGNVYFADKASNVVRKLTLEFGE
jgi:DNA-binding beta-propeller fold protein YncE